MIAIPEKTGIHINKKTCTVLDNEPIKIFTTKNTKTHKPKETFKL